MGFVRVRPLAFRTRFPKRGEGNNLTPHPPTPLRCVALNFRNVAIDHLALGCRLRIWTPFRITMAFQGVGGLLLDSHGRLQNTETGCGPPREGHNQNEHNT